VLNSENVSSTWFARNETPRNIVIAKLQNDGVQCSNEANAELAVRTQTFEINTEKFPTGESTSYPMDETWLDSKIAPAAKRNDLTDSKATDTKNTTA
jgi:hypothetical protein